MGCEGAGAPVGMALPGSELGGCGLGRKQAGQRMGAEELHRGCGPAGKMPTGKAVKLPSDFEGRGCNLSCGFD